MKRCWLLVVFALGFAVTSHAQVRVVKAGGAKYSLDLSGFRASASAAPAMFRKTLDADLAKCGWFILAPGRAAFTVQGSIADAGSTIEVTCQAWETATRDSKLSKKYSAPINDTRRLAHQVANDLIQAITGQKPLFVGRLTLVGNRTGAKEIYIADPDGQNVVQVTHDKKISVGPKWSPDGTKISYTGYLKGWPDLYQITLASGARERIAGFPGLNTGGSYSPDGRLMAIILSKDGNPELYVKNLAGGGLTRITSTPRGAEADPCWSPDGSQVAYVSDVSGSPQIYVVSRSGGAPRRLTSRGSQNVAPDWGENGLIAYSSLIGGHFQACVMDPATLDTKQLTADGTDYEDPCWAPDGRHIACARTQGYSSSIYLLDTQGDAPIGLLAIQGNWFSPAWSSK